MHHGYLVKNAKSYCPIPDIWIEISRTVIRDYAVSMWFQLIQWLTKIWDLWGLGPLMESKLESYLSLNSRLLGRSLWFMPWEWWWSLILPRTGVGEEQWPRLLCGSGLCWGWPFCGHGLCWKSPSGGSGLCWGSASCGGSCCWGWHCGWEFSAEDHH